MCTFALQFSFPGVVPKGQLYFFENSYLMEKILPVGKLPAPLLAKLLAQAPTEDAQVLLGPGLGLDCAIVDIGDRLLVYKSDPITFATAEIGWYAVQVNVNDLATVGATPRWLLATLLLPENQTTPTLAEQICQQLYRACRSLNITVIGGHTEITYGLDRPILAGTLIGEVAPDRLVTPQGVQPGDRVLLTKGVPIEGTAILAREFPERLKDTLDQTELDLAQSFLYQPGISVLREAQLALDAGRVTAMHDPTEGGLVTALWELAEASARSFYIDPAVVPVPALANRVCRAFELDPLATIASGALLLTAPAGEADNIRLALEQASIPCTEIGYVEAGPVSVWRKLATTYEIWARPQRDEIARVYETS